MRLGLALVEPVVFVVLQRTRLDTGFDEGSVEGIGAGAGGHVQRPVGSPVGIATLGPGFGTLEVRQHVSVGPVRQRIAGPAVVIERMAAHVGHAIDG